MNSAMTLLPHLLRPWWLLALAAMPLLAWAWRRRMRSDTPWTRAVDPHLLPALLCETRTSRRTAAAWLFALCYAIAVLALAGPAWRQPVATYATQAPLVVVEDMSSHMLVADLPPSRLLRARLKVQQLIAQRKGGQLGLVAYAGDAFTVAPVSDDAHSLDDLVVALTPDTMPVDGQRADLALHRAADLLEHAGYPQGDILLMTDDADAAAMAVAREMHAKGHRVDVLGIGTASGAPLPSADGTFAQDDHGGLRIARLDEAALRELATAGGGRYATITASSDDLAALDALDPSSPTSATAASIDAMAWRDDGPWLLLLLLPLASLGFRRGWLAVVLLAVMSMPAQRVEAQPSAWQGLWQRTDQRADQALHAGDAQAADALARTPAQRAAAAYLKGDYAAAAAGWGKLDDADAHYNRGNALAQMQHYDEAIDAWQSALRLRPGMVDAQANIAVARKLLKQQQPSDKQQQDSRQDPSQAQSQKKDQQGQSDNQENTQRSQQQAQQQGGSQGAPKDSPRQDSQQPSREGDNRQQGASQQADSSQQHKPDASRQAKADAAEKQALQRALMERGKNGSDKQQQAAQETIAQRERREANRVLMQRVPDDPGSLLKRKFQLEYQRRQQGGS